MQATVQLVGKRQGRSLVAEATGHNRGLLFLRDSVSKRQFLIDTGAEVSVLPATGLDTRTRQPGTPLLAANGNSIRRMELANSLFILLQTDISGLLS